MKFKTICAFLAVLAIIVSIIAIFYEKLWLQRTSQLFVIFPLFAYYFDKLSRQKLNFFGFFLSLIAANLSGVFNELWYFSHIAIGFWLVCFGFLVKEVIRYTEYSRGSRLMQLFFLVVVAVYTYLLSLHLIEIESNMKDNFQFLMYLFYYFSLLILGVAGLIYYLNSFSRKSVYFICFVISLIFSDVLRDMGIFYFRDLSVEIVGTLIKFAAFKLVFLFFVTTEKRLRLLNLV